MNVFNGFWHFETEGQEVPASNILLSTGCQCLYQAWTWYFKPCKQIIARINTFENFDINIIINMYLPRAAPTKHINDTVVPTTQRWTSYCSDKLIRRTPNALYKPSSIQLTMNKQNAMNHEYELSLARNLCMISRWDAFMVLLNLVVLVRSKSDTSKQTAMSTLYSNFSLKSLGVAWYSSCSGPCLTFIVLKVPALWLFNY